MMAPSAMSLPIPGPIKSPRASVETVDCTLNLACTPETLHAHLDLSGPAPDAGDSVRLLVDHVSLANGETKQITGRAEIIRAGRFRRRLARFLGLFQILHLIEVGFDPKEV
jgi:hypothetical protein